ncbi:MAG: NINE protein [Desulfobulbaceae bacterium]|nr:NINE protein [Desulfobulbaceae bacterium]
MDQQAPVSQNKAIDEKFCGSCGEIIKIKAEICPKCGVRQGNPLNKTALLVITFFLGGIGAHKFYLGKHWQGVLYMLFCWTGIPSLIALVEFIIYAFTSSEQLQDKYSAGSGTIIIAVVAGFFGLIFIVGILAAIAIPQFAAYKNKAYQHNVKSELQNLLVAEQTYFAEHNLYSPNLESLDFVPATQDITFEITSADENCFEAVAIHNQLTDTMSVDCNGLRQ